MVLLFSFTFLLILQRAVSISCLDNDGIQVDWWFMYKLPQGYQTVYIDANTGPGLKSQKLQISDRPLDDKESPCALVRTLRSLLPSSGSNSTHRHGYLMYNDQPDDHAPGPNYGHAKGVVAIDAEGESAFWITHSTPHFPSSSGSAKFYFPEKEITFGQTFLCISLTEDSIENVAQQLLYVAPYIYFNDIRKDIVADHPALVRLIEKDFVKDAGAAIAYIVSIGGTNFTSFAKNREWNDDLYESLVAPGLGADLLVESWLRGKEEGTYCRPQHDFIILDVESLAAEALDGSLVTWNEGSDHGKWAVALDASNVLCIADINRMTTQRDRGGGAVCFSDAGLARSLKGSTTNATSCQ